MGLVLLLVMLLSSCVAYPVDDLIPVSITQVKPRAEETKVLWRDMSPRDLFHQCGNYRGCYEEVTFNRKLRIATVYCNFKDIVACKHELDHVVYGPKHRGD